MFPNGNSLKGLEDAPKKMDMIGKIGSTILFRTCVAYKFGIPNVNGLIPLYENKLDELDTPIGVDDGGVNVVTV